MKKNNRFLSRCANRTQRGFTLIELLVAIAIIAVLAGLLFVSANSALQKARGIQCAGNMKEVGTAIALFCQDNAETLPGPVYGLQVPPAGAGPGTLSNYLYSYLNCKDPTDCFERFLMCPANKVEAANTNKYQRGSYLVNCTLNPTPFGYPYSTLPVRLTQIQGLYNAGISTTWAMEDMDAWNYVGGEPATPVHGAGRNVLYLDGRVEYVLTKSPSQTP